MCGIVGYVDYNGQPISQETFDRMMTLLIHRGPDDQGKQFFTNEFFVALGHTRLSIIDLSPAGHQPMTNDDGSLWITYNGEIYNYKEIRKDLAKKGFRFKSKSDTEILLKSYEAWGEECLNRFNGMFAFAIWDSRKRELFAAKDRLGIKPFYYYHSGDRMIFASEIKSILASNMVCLQPDWEAIHNPWHYQSTPNTGFKKIKKLPPGHYLKFSKNGLILSNYWDIFPTEDDITENTASEELEKLLKDAVKLQMISDVPVGAFLSGGLDSSCIVALMSHLNKEPIRTFTIKFAEEDNQYEAMPLDSIYANRVAKLFGCHHKEIVISPDIVNLLPYIVNRVEEPLADPAAINTYLISKASREANVTVLLNGMGGDEVFGGYRKYLACLFAEGYQNYVPSLFRKALECLVRRIPVAGKNKGFKKLRWAKRFFSFASSSRAQRALSADQSLPRELYRELFVNSNEFPYDSLSNVGYHLRFLINDELSYLTQICLMDTKTFLPDHNLCYTDKASMAASVETRPPLIDHRIVEFMFKLPPRYRISGTNQKYLLKKVMQSYLPKDIIHRPKVPFGAPLRSWIRGPLKEMIDDLLNPTAIKSRGLYDPNTVWRLIQDDRKGLEDNAHLIWTLLCREIWFQEFFISDSNLTKSM